MRSILLIMIMWLASTLEAEDTRMYQRNDGGYDFFDFSGMLISYSTPNEKGSYDFFDRTGKSIGWAEAKEGGKRIEVFDATGTIYRVVERSADGTTAMSSPLGKLYNLTAPNVLGGADNYDPKGLLTSYTANGEYVVVKPDEPE